MLHSLLLRMNRFLFLITILVTNFCSAQTTNTNSRFAGKGFIIEFPSSWSLDTSHMMKTECILFASPEGDNDRFRENINVLIQPLGDPLFSLEKYKTISEQQLTHLPGKIETEESAIILKDGKTYYRMSYVLSQEQFQLHITSICYIKNAKAFLVTFTTEAAKYETYKNEGEKVLASFQLSD